MANLNHQCGGCLSCSGNDDVAAKSDEFPEHHCHAGGGKNVGWGSYIKITASDRNNRTKEATIRFSWSILQLSPGDGAFKVLIGFYNFIELVRVLAMYESRCQSTTRKSMVELPVSTCFILVAIVLILKTVSVMTASLNRGEDVECLNVSFDSFIHVYEDSVWLHWISMSRLFRGRIY